MALKNIFHELKAFIITEKAFFKNVSFVFGGKVYVAILSIFLTPIIARLFTPEDYGEFALYNTIVQNLVVVGTLSLPLAVSTAKKDDLENVLNLTITVILYISILFSLGLFFLNPYLDSTFSTTIFSRYWGVILIGFILTAIVSTLKAYNVRLKNFTLNSTVVMLEGSSAKAFNLGSGWLGFNAIGLIFSDLISKIIGLILLLRKVPFRFSFSFSYAKKLIWKYKQFPTYIMPSQWVGMLNNHFIIIATAFLFSKNELGQVTMAIGLLGIPLNVLVNSFQPVITERLSVLKGMNLKDFFGHTVLVLFILAAVLFMTVFILPAETFTLLLGDKWNGIKPIINVLAIFYIILLLDQSFENGFIVINKQKIFFYFSLFELQMQVTIFAFAYLQKMHLFQILISLGMVRGVVSIIRVIYLWKNTVKQKIIL